jgi:phosphocarrier protein
MGLMMLAAAPGCTIEIKGRGPDGEQAVDALVALVDAKFDED